MLRNEKIFWLAAGIGMIDVKVVFAELRITTLMTTPAFQYRWCIEHLLDICGYEDVKQSLAK